MLELDALSAPETTRSDLVSEQCPEADAALLQLGLHGFAELLQDFVAGSGVLRRLPVEDRPTFRAAIVLAFVIIW